ncbi:hypothetical protein [Prosthecobacter fluviatilis]|uniref:Uncharacterized protein n=1 Tax=Prosthecobacter fluviatilis TaxID=445931 RepID=A0ABW0KRI6_9BACT
MNTDGLDVQLLISKTLGFTKAISKLSPEERSQFPSQTFGDDYNSLRTLVLTRFPELQKFMPPVALSDMINTGFLVTLQRYGEILTFCEQIYQMLAVVNEEKE